jgi:hypothetical protein
VGQIRVSKSSSDQRNENDARGGVRGGGYASFHRFSLCDVCITRVGAGDDRDLWRAGIPGVKAYAEIGIREALGGRRQDVLWLVMREGAKFSFAGIGRGLAGAMVFTRLLASELYGVSPMDTVTYVGVTCAMAAVTLLACYVPTRRAMRVDPLTALRQD